MPKIMKYLIICHIIQKSYVCITEINTDCFSLVSDRMKQRTIPNGLIQQQLEKALYTPRDNTALALDRNIPQLIISITIAFDALDRFVQFFASSSHQLTRSKHFETVYIGMDNSKIRHIYFILYYIS